MRRAIAAAIQMSIWTPQHVQAQEAGDARAGLVLARQVCASCHAVLPGETRSPDARAPAFGALASTPGMTGTALTVALRTSHETMPNLMLEREELQNVIAYILSLEDRRYCRSDQPVLFRGLPLRSRASGKLLRGNI